MTGRSVVCVSIRQSVCVGHTGEPCAKTTEPVEIAVWMDRMCPRWEPRIRFGTYGRHLANISEQNSDVDGIPYSNP